MKYWIWSNEHGAWWAADRRGYVRNLAAAGRYSAGDAARIVEGANLAQMDRPGLERHEVAIPVEAVGDEGDHAATEELIRVAFQRDAMRPVVEAAGVWAQWDERGLCRTDSPSGRLEDAVDAYRAMYPRPVPDPVDAAPI